MIPPLRLPSPQPRAQRGIVLLISLILLVSLTLAGLALFRQVGTGVLVARNLTFSNAALVASDLGTEAARNWLVTGGANLQVGSTANAYYPAWCNTSLDAAGNPDADGNGTVDDCLAAPAPSTFDPLTYNWANSVLVTNDDGNGNAVRYVIHRLCRIPGSLNFTNSDGVPQECVNFGSASTGGTKGAASYGILALKNTMQPYFRITTQTTGPSNTVSYSQVILY
jgi:Tfp pilus assembly protein PilX